MIQSNENNSEYLKNLMDKHEKNADKTKNYIDSMHQNYEQLIKDGKYQIKGGENFKKSQSPPPQKLEMNKANKMKRDLEGKLSFVDKRIGQITETDDLNKPIKDDDRRKFVNEMTKYRKQVEKSRENQLKEMKERELSERKKSEEELRKKQLEILEKRKAQIIKRNSEKESSKKQQQTDYESRNKMLKIKLKQKILSERYNEKFQQSQNVTLEERKKKLAQIRSLHKPLSKSQFEQHLQKIQQLRNEVPKSQSQILSSRYIPSEGKKFYESVWYQKQKQLKRQFEDLRHAEQLSNLKEIRDKQVKYSKYVRQNYVPEPSNKKINELLEKNKTVKVPRKSKKQITNMGLKYLQFSKEQGDPQKVTDDTGQIKKAYRYINYLEEIKKNREPVQGTKSSQDFVQSIRNKKNISESEKAQKILDYAKNIERKAKMKEEIGKDSKMIDEELDDLYMEAIEAKLSILANQ